MKIDQRSKALATVLALAVMLVMPLPDFSAPLNRVLIVFLLWTTCLSWALVCYFKSNWLNEAWAAFLVATIFHALVFKNPLAMALSLIWKFWLNVRMNRLAQSALPNDSVKSGIAALILLVSPLFLFLTTPAFSAEVPDNKKGHSIESIASCSVIDQVPWTFRKGKRQSRFLIRDRLRLTTQPDFSVWEIHQILDGSGYVAYVFKRIREDGIEEAIVTKEVSYNRILQKGNQRRIAEVRSLKTMTDRPVLEFVNQEGGSVIVIPSYGGLSKLQINFSMNKGRSAPPVLLVGRSCERSEQDTKAEEDDAAERQGIIKAK